MFVLSSLVALIPQLRKTIFNQLDGITSPGSRYCTVLMIVDKLDTVIHILLFFLAGDLALSSNL